MDSLPSLYINENLLHSIQYMQPMSFNYYEIERKIYFPDDWQDVESQNEKYVEFELIEIDSKLSEHDYKIKSKIDDDKDEYETENLQHVFCSNTGSLSYAEKLKKNLQPPVTVTYEDKTLDIRFESWHTMIKSGLNEVYCMVCEQKNKQQDMISHCHLVYHLENIQKCEIIYCNEDFVIRKLNEKFSHCTKCNSLHFIHDARNHLKKAHGIISIENEAVQVRDATNKDEKSNILHDNWTVSCDKRDSTAGLKANEIDISRLTVDNNLSQNVGLNDQKESNKTNKIDTNQITDTSFSTFTNNNYLLSPTNEIDTKHNKILIDIVNDRAEMQIFVFGCKLTISMLSLNMISKPDKSFYYCGLCHMTFLCGLLDNHLNFPNHKMLLSCIHFLPEYSVNLIRYVRAVFHCTLCNVPVPPPFILQHNVELKHVQLLTVALNKRQTSNNTRTETSSNLHIQTAEYSKALTTTNIKMDSKEICTDLKPITVKNGDGAEGNIEMNAPLGKVHDDANVNTSFMCDTIEKNDKISGRDHGVPKKKERNVFDHKVRRIRSTAGFDISFAAANILVPNGDGDNYCGACEITLNKEPPYEHINKDEHTKNISKYLFLEDYADDLIRQLSSKYHCATCNVLIKQTQIEKHLEWPTHKTLLETSKIKKFRERHKKHCVATQKEQPFLANEMPVEVLMRAKIIASTEHQNLNPEPELNTNEEMAVAVTESNCQFPSNVSESKKPNNIDNTLIRTPNNSNMEVHVNVGGIDSMFHFFNWNGIRAVCGGFKCILCQIKFYNKIEEHVECEEHEKIISNSIVMERFLPAVIRKINDKWTHCVVCNKQLQNDNTLLAKHIKNKSHKKNMKKLLSGMIKNKVALEGRTLIRNFLLNV